jgi:hypothetical protein
LWGAAVGATGWLTDYPPAVVAAAVVLICIATFMVLHSVSGGSSSADKARQDAKQKGSGNRQEQIEGGQTKAETSGAGSHATSLRDNYGNLIIGGVTPVEQRERRTGTGRRSTDQRPEPRPLRVSLRPSSGNAPDLRLTVLQRGKARHLFG